VRAPQELNPRGTHLLFRDKKRQLSLFNIAKQERTTLLNYSGYVQWVPQVCVCACVCVYACVRVKWHTCPTFCVHTLEQCVSASPRAPCLVHVRGDAHTHVSQQNSVMWRRARAARPCVWCTTRVPTQTPCTHSTPLHPAHAE